MKEKNLESEWKISWKEKIIEEYLQTNMKDLLLVPFTPFTSFL